MDIKKLSNIFFAAAGAAILIFFLCAVFMYSDDRIWHVFSVCMPIAQLCLVSGIVLRIVDFMRKR